MKTEFKPEYIPCMFYAEWYKKDVSPNLTFEQKKKLLMKLSELSLSTPIFQLEKIPLEDFPELKSFAHTETFSGLQMYVVMSEVFNEVSRTKIEPPYPRLPSEVKKS